MDIIGVIIFILFMALSVLGKLGREAGQDGAPQRPRRVPPWFPDFEEEIPPVIEGPAEKRRPVPVDRVPRDTRLEPADGQQRPAAKTRRQASQKAPAIQRNDADDARSPLKDGTVLYPAPALQPASGAQSALIGEPAAEDIIKGVIWAEILSPPRAKRPLEVDCLRPH